MFTYASFAGFFRKHIAFSLATAILLACMPKVFAQQSSDAVVVGTVVDTSQASIAGASVTLTHLATNARTAVLTDERGQYRTPPLRLGEYTLSVEAEGFKRFSQRGITLNIGDVRQIDATLEIG